MTCVLQLVLCSAPSVPQPVFTITEKAPTRAFSPTSAFTFKTGEGPSRGLLRDCTTSPINRFAALAVQCDAGVFIVMVGAAV